jgi:hypothetical protein
MQAEGRFPQRIKLGDRAVGWLESEVRDWRHELKPAVLIGVANDQVTTAPLATLLSRGKHWSPNKYIVR